MSFKRSLSHWAGYMNWEWQIAIQLALYLCIKNRIRNSHSHLHTHTHTRAIAYVFVFTILFPCLFVVRQFEMRVLHMFRQTERYDHIYRILCILSLCLTVCPCACLCGSVCVRTHVVMRGLLRAQRWLLHTLRGKCGKNGKTPNKSCPRAVTRWVCVC